MKLPDAHERLRAIDAETVGNTPVQFDAFIKSEIGKWAGLLRSAGLQAE